MTSRAQPTSVTAAAQVTHPNALVAPLARRARTPTEVRSAVMPVQTGADLVAFSGVCASAGVSCWSSKPQVSASVRATWSEDGNGSDGRRESHVRSSRRTAATDRNALVVKHSQDGGALAGHGFGSAASGHAAMVTSSESLALAGLMLIARFAAATVWRSEFGPLPLERPG